MVGRRKLGRLLLGGILAGGGVAGTVAYARADSIERRKIKVGLKGVIRFIRSISVGLLISLDYYWAGRGLDEESEEYDRAIEPCHQRCADRIVAGALKNGGLYIKLGQGLSTFNQALPRQYLDTLKTLQDKALAREFQELDTLFMEDFGKSPAKLFKSFDQEPIAAASLAQVFKAVTHSNKTVAVKAQYIDLRDRYDGDLWTIQILLKMVAWIHPKFKLSWIFEELRYTLAEELDFYHEGQNMERCKQDLRVFPWVYVPQVEWDLTSKRVLTAEWIDGCRVTDKKAILSMGLSLADVAHKVISAFAYQLFHTGFVHADPHPGNILIRPRCERRSDAEVVLLDHGLYMQVENSVRQSLCKIWKSIIVHDLDTLKDECSKYGVKNYGMLAIILTGRSLDTHKKMLGLGSSAMTKEDWLAVRSSFIQFDEVMAVLRALPSSLILIVRNINIVRSLNRELNCPVNRYNIMARSAIRGYRSQSAKGKWTVRSKISAWLEGAWFEMQLLTINLQFWWSVKVLQLMRWAGWVPQEMQVLEQAMMS